MLSRHLWVLLSCAAAAIAVAAVPSQAQDLAPYAATTDNVVTGTIIPYTWDSQDPMTVSGTLRDYLLEEPSTSCIYGDPVPNCDSLIVEVLRVSGQPGHAFCVTGSNTERRAAFSPGTDSQGHFSFTIAGGGVSYIYGDGTDCSSVIQLRFKKGSATWRVLCGSVTDSPLCYSCDNAPRLYNHLASPDLNADGYVDASDYAIFNYYYLGKTITATRGWQADFNHSGSPTVDASDLSYFVGRMGIQCDDAKVSAGSYQMEIRNLQLTEVQDVLREQGLTCADVLASWDQMELTYDRAEAGRVLAGLPLPTAPISWSKAKKLFD